MFRRRSLFGGKEGREDKGGKGGEKRESVKLESQSEIKESETKVFTIMCQVYSVNNSVNNNEQAFFVKPWLDSLHSKMTQTENVENRSIYLEIIQPLSKTTINQFNLTLLSLGTQSILNAADKNPNKQKTVLLILSKESLLPNNISSLPNANLFYLYDKIFVLSEEEQRIIINQAEMPTQVFIGAQLLDHKVCLEKGELVKSESSTQIAVPKIDVPIFYLKTNWEREDKIKKEVSETSSEVSKASDVAYAKSSSVLDRILTIICETSCKPENSDEYKYSMKILDPDILKRNEARRKKQAMRLPPDELRRREKREKEIQSVVAAMSDTDKTRARSAPPSSIQSNRRKS